MAYLRDKTRDKVVVSWRDPDGKVRSKTFERAKGQRPQDLERTALRYGEDQERAARTGAYVDPRAGRVTIGELLAPWEARKRGRGLAVKSVDRDLHLAKRVRAKWGDVRVDRISTGQVQEWMGDLLGAEGLSPSTVREVVRVLREIVQVAADDQLVATNAVHGVTLPKKTRGRDRYLTADEVERLAEAAEAEYPETGADIVLTLSYTGLRWGEMAGLRVGRVDVSKGRVHVQEALVEPDSEPPYMGPPKGGRQRTVAPPSFVIALLAARVAHAASDDLVFASPDGGLLVVSNARRRWWRRAVNAADLAPLSPHDLRHTAASLAIGAGASPLAVARMLGHASPHETLNRYAGLFDSDLDRVAAVLGDHREAARNSQD